MGATKLTSGLRIGFEQVRGPGTKGVLLWSLLGWMAVIISGCVPAKGGWDASNLRMAGEKGERGGHRLGDLSPQPFPLSGHLVLFLCRWNTEHPISTSLPADASEAETRMLRKVLEAWSQAGLGVRFVEETTPGAGLHFKFVKPGDSGPLPKGAGDALADCRVDPDRDEPGRLSAELAYASVYLKREDVDWRGQVDVMSWEERYGAALHEVGHALGFSSHVAAGKSIMNVSPEVARRAGEELLAGRWPGDSTLKALYALPNGLVVGRRELQGSTIDRISDFMTAAEVEGLRGPYTRVGDHGARILYRDQRGAPVSLGLRPWPMLRSSDELRLSPNRLAQPLLERLDPGRSKK